MGLLQGLISIICVIFGVLSTICSGVVMKFTPYVTAMFVVLEIVQVTSYGIFTVIGYGCLVYLIAWLILIINSILLYVVVK